MEVARFLVNLVRVKVLGLFLALLVVAIASVNLLLFAFGERSPTKRLGGSASEGKSREQAVLYHISWAYHYPDLKSMIRDSDLIVIGVVVNSSSYSGGRYGIIFTDNKVKVERFLKGSSDGYIVVKQTGGVINDTVYEVSDDPLMEVGEKAVLFLKYSPETGKYYTTPQGRLIVIGDKVYSLDKVYPKRNIILPFSIDGLSLSDLIRIIRATGS